MIEHTHLNSLIAQVVQTLEARGFDRQPLLRLAGIDPAQLDKAEARLPCSQVDNLWQIAMKASDDDLSIIVDTARRYDVGSLHVLGFGLQACVNLADASKRLARAAAIFNTALYASCASVGGEFQFTFEYMYEGAAPAKDIATATILVQVWRRLLRPELVPLSVQFATVDEPTDEAKKACLEGFFGCPVLYRQKYNCITLPLSLAREPLPNANAPLSARGEAVISGYLAELERSAIASAVVRCIADGAFTKDDVARRLNMSTRSLQRRLADDKLCFSDLLAETRRDMASVQLRAGRLTVKEVAHMLGYSDPANFSRAFRAWYGVAPDAFRRGEQTVTMDDTQAAG